MLQLQVKYVVFCACDTLSFGFIVIDLEFDVGVGQYADMCSC